MGKKLIITETQLESLKINLQESEVYSRLVKTIKDELTQNYEPLMGIKRKGGEYINTPMIKIKIDGENITPKALYDYMLYKYKTGEEFMKQVISDWVFGKISDDNRLSKNVALSETEIGGKGDIELADVLQAQPYEQILWQVQQDWGTSSDLYQALINIFMDKKPNINKLISVLKNYDVYDAYAHFLNLNEYESEA